MHLRKRARLGRQLPLDVGGGKYGLQGQPGALHAEPDVKGGSKQA
jgi:hypothetical protein